MDWTGEDAVCRVGGIVGTGAGYEVRGGGRGSSRESLSGDA